MIKGNINGIKNTMINRLEGLFDLKQDKYCICSYELAEELASISKAIKKEICIVVSRQGKIVGVSVGRVNAAEIPSFDPMSKKLSGYRVIHTHPSGDSTLSEMDTSALLELKLDAIVAIGIKDNIDNASFNVGLCTVTDNKLACEEHKNLSMTDTLQLNFKNILEEIEKQISCYGMKDDPEEAERAILIGTDSEESLDELIGLAEACNVIPVYKMFQRKTKIHSAFFAGQGKVQEIAHLRQIKNANLVIFDDELSGSQVRNLEEAIKCKVIDRTTLILDIFARRARSREGILQVELAMLNHKLPRLKDANANLARIKGGVGMKGGIGSRGPGEKKLETDRRHIENRIEEIRNELSRVMEQRVVQKSNRAKNNISRVAIVGYTNAGKSTLRNKLCQISASNTNSKEGVLEADMLFATLDTTVRAVTLHDNRKIALSDTVGFISKLPHELVEAFKSTLEEVVEADLLLHVVDASNEEAIMQIRSVNTVLDELKAMDKNTILVLNKIDMATASTLQLINEFLKYNKVIAVSALTGENLSELLHMIGREIPVKLVEKEFIIPYDQQKLISLLHQSSSVLKEDYKEEGTHIKALVHDEIYRTCIAFEI